MRLFFLPSLPRVTFLRVIITIIASARSPACPALPRTFVPAARPRCVHRAPGARSPALPRSSALRALPVPQGARPPIPHAPCARLGLIQARARQPAARVQRAPLAPFQGSARLPALETALRRPAMAARRAPPAPPMPVHLAQLAAFAQAAALRPPLPAPPQQPAP
jgi:hypothetical protein